ncbi:MAG: class I SAM-dependent methyltransferase [Acidobacteria bacterium]|nr:class I SAM-dependent methyltransferase [Acidobacteriota bacterium]
MNPAKAIYHKFIPESVRNPVGMARRRIVDRFTRLSHSESLPPPELLMNVQMTPFVDEFIRIGERSARSIQSALQPCVPAAAHVLDFGCGCGRTLLPLSKTTAWELHGCDVDSEAVAWLARTASGDRFRVNGTKPPLPFAAESFNAIYAVSVFTHFSEAEQYAWSAELARVLVPRGVAAITTMGDGVIENFPAHVTPENRARLRNCGFLFIEDERAFNARAAFHTLGGLTRLLSAEFDLWQHYERGLDGFQDLTLFVKR